eukprot:GEMP01001663.1.p1 GENE.GEMP01001663.1~~GEMP01001663.1.p1  ORF type:complete len:864 (+),score=122.97 GEMP01001663.1:140-2731(+)
MKVCRYNSDHSASSVVPITRGDSFRSANTSIEIDDFYSTYDFGSHTGYHVRLHTWTLRFADAIMEEGYLRWAMRWGGVRVEAFLSFTLAYLTAELFMDISDGNYRGFMFTIWTTPARIAYNIIWITLIISFLMAAIFTRLVACRFHKTSLLAESFFVSVISFGIVVFPLANRWRVVQLLGSDLEKSFPSNLEGGDKGYVDDSVTFPAMLAALGYVCLVIPIRFHVAVCLEALFFVSAIWSTMVAGAPESNKPWYVFCIIFFSMVIIIIIKRDLEKHSRTVYMRERSSLHAVRAIKDMVKDGDVRAKRGDSDPISKLEVAREKLITLGNCLAFDDTTRVNSPMAIHEVDTRLKLVTEILHMISSPGNLLSCSSSAQLSCDTESHIAIRQFLEENFWKEKDFRNPMEEETMSGLFTPDTESFGTTVNPGSVSEDVTAEDIRMFCRDWFFSVASIYRQLGCRTLICLLPQELRRFVKDAEGEMNCFVSGLSSRYNDVPYHHEAHATQVTNHALCLARILRISNESTNIERFSFLVAAAAHDVGHFGRNNKFCMMTKHEVAITYNDKSILENMHSSITFRLLEDPSMFILKNYTEMEYRLFRSIVIDLILATDMSLNADAMSAFRVRTDCEDFSVSKDDDRRMCYRVIIKASDIGHGALKWEEHCVWSYWLRQEFFEQGDAEKSLGLPVSALCDRQDTDFPASQQGFLRYCCVPLFDCLLTMSISVSNTGEAHNAAFADSEIRGSATTTSPTMGSMSSLGQPPRGRSLPRSVPSHSTTSGGSEARKKIRESSFRPDNDLNDLMQSRTTFEILNSPEMIIRQIQDNLTSWKDMEVANKVGIPADIPRPDSNGNGVVVDVDNENKENIA